MANLKGLKEEHETIESMNLIVQSYQEISVMRMQKIRSRVIQTRDFMEQLSTVFRDVKHAYKKLVEALEKSNKKHNVAFEKGKNAAVLLTSNTKLYGSIMSNIFNEFLGYIKAHPEVEIVIIGKLGLELYHEQGETRKYSYFELPTTTLTMEDIRPVMTHLTGFDNINVFHGKFQSLLTQAVSVSNITGESSAELLSEKTEEKEFFFEPTLDDVLLLFKDQIVASLLNQTFSESELAQHASRIQSMENASQNISHALTFLGRDILKQKKKGENKKQLEQFVSIISYH